MSFAAGATIRDREQKRVFLTLENDCDVRLSWTPQFKAYSSFDGKYVELEIVNR